MENPPFDGKPCPVCPVEIRGLFAAAANLAQAIIRRDFSRAESRARELAAAVGDVQPLVDAHFADPAHSHGCGAV